MDRPCPRRMSPRPIARTASARPGAAGGWPACRAFGTGAHRCPGPVRHHVPDLRRGRDKLHFASADFTLQATRSIKAEDADKPIDVTLSPTRLVRARVIEVPSDDPKAYLNWTAYTVDAAGKVADQWQRVDAAQSRMPTTRIT